ELYQEIREVAGEGGALTAGCRHEGKDTRTGEELDAQTHRGEQQGGSREPCSLPAPSSLSLLLRLRLCASTRACVKKSSTQPRRIASAAHAAGDNLASRTHEHDGKQGVA